MSEDFTRRTAILPVSDTMKWDIMTFSLLQQFLMTTTTTTTTTTTSFICMTITKYCSIAKAT